MARGRPSKKAQIIQAACELFIKQGYQGTSIDQVVAAAAVSKPTVYSNFATKLTLWEAVLEEIIQRAEQDLAAEIIQLTQAKEQDVLSGWLSLWRTWCAQPERIATYRILLGEQYKMHSSTVALFTQFEEVLHSQLKAWLKTAHGPENAFFTLTAISKEAMLTPALLKKEILDNSLLQSSLKIFFNQK
ncbi:TetR/AcrR family transcriptional regulator [Marinomonas dokdonensis]|uniref:TetR/AcrR family transcriptional regulator n=1 Tax=Marinomonas dokdonensis TaxID=328224 RepID=UPI0040555131